MGGWRADLAAGLLGAGSLALLHVPAALAFPHVAQIDATRVYSVAPIGSRTPRVLTRAAGQ